MSISQVGDLRYLNLSNYWISQFPDPLNPDHDLFPWFEEPPAMLSSVTGLRGS